MERRDREFMRATGIAGLLVMALLFMIGTQAQGQSLKMAANQTLSSGQSMSVPNTIGVSAITAEYKIAGGPATASIVLKGCMRGGTCDTKETSTATTSSIRALLGLYDFYTVDATFTGGTSPTVTVNIIGATGASPSNTSGVGPAAPTNITQVGGSALAEGQAAMAASIPVVIASNQTNVPANIAQVGGASVALGQTTMAASVPVALASNQSTIAIAGQVAEAASATGVNPTLTGYRSATGVVTAFRMNTNGPADGAANTDLEWYDNTNGGPIKYQVRPELTSNLNGTHTWDRYRSVMGYRLVSATNTANVQTIDTGNLVGSLSVHTSCSAGTASLTVDVSVDNTNFLNVDTIAAAAQIVKIYGSNTAGAAATTSSAGALAPLSFRYIKLTQASCGVGNTGTMNASVKGS